MVVKGLSDISLNPTIAATGVVLGHLKKKVLFMSLFDKVYDDERRGMPTNEQGHAKLMEDACMIALSKGEIRFQAM